MQASLRACLFVLALSGSYAGLFAQDASTPPARRLRFQAESPRAARAWQRAAREQLVRLMMGGTPPVALAPEARLLRSLEDPARGFRLEELAVRSLPEREVHAWLAAPLRAVRDMRPTSVGERAVTSRAVVPVRSTGKPLRTAGVLVLHGHGGTGEDVVRGRGLYWYGRALAEMGYAVIAPDIGSHELQHTNWTLMGERVWDALRCLEHLAQRPEVDPERLGVAGLSLGGETAMYVAALDDRVHVVDSSGWLTTVANMKQGHCPCWNFPGLEEHFDFADIFACVAPRRLVLEVGEKERAPGGFPVAVARQAFAEIQRAYGVFGAADKVLLDVHAGGHVFRGAEFWEPVRQVLGREYPYAGSESPWGGGSAGVREALRRGEVARRCFVRAERVLEGWWALRDSETGLFPRRVDQPVWAPQDNAADMLPFLLITAHYLQPARTAEVMAAFHSEKSLTSRIGPLPDWYALTNRTFLHREVDLTRVIFGAAEYCKDGLVPMTEAMGRGPWIERMIELMQGIFDHAPIRTEYGAIPADDAEVNGDLLQALARLHGVTRDVKYGEWAGRIADAWCSEVLPRSGGLPPYRWDFTEHRVVNDRLNLNDHGNELIGGLAEWYVLARQADPARAARHEAGLRRMFHRLLERARNDDGLWYNVLTPSTGEPVNRETPDTWGYALAAAVTFGTAVRDDMLVEAARTALRHIDQPRYLDWNGADSYADSIEGALLLLNRLPGRPGFSWLEKMLPLFLGKQQESGVVEGWYGDGNYARTALMAALYFTQGTICRPWRSDLRWGALLEEDQLRVVIEAAEPWAGRLCFDMPRHRVHVGLPANYPRLNEFPEWFVVETERRYRVRLPRAGGARSGRELLEGLPLEVRPGTPVVIEVSR